ncbi:MAG: AAA family ATPase [Candidatus Electrothrix sp.]
MYLRHFGLKFPPFTRQPNLDVFFAQAGRKNILKDLRHDLEQGNVAMLLTGPKASGKTLFCRLIRHRLEGSAYKVVYLENPIGSFDELLRQICLQLGMPSPVDTEQDMVAVLRALLGGWKEKGKRVLLLIDEAEKMFLAALERLFHLLNELNEQEQYGVQAILTGQQALNISIEQLSGYCEDVRIASAYALEAFSQEETEAYLTYRLGAAGGDKGIKDPVFSGKAVQEIFRLGKGIPGVTDGIAEVALENAAAAGASSVLPVHVTVPDDPVAPPLTFDDEESGGRRKGLLLLLFLCLLAFFFFGRTSFFSDQEDTQQEVLQESVGVVPENTEILLALPGDEGVPLPFVEEDDGSDNPAEESSDSSKNTEEPSLFSLPVPQRPDFKKRKKAVVVSEISRVQDTPGRQGAPERKSNNTENAASLAGQAVPLAVATSVAVAEEQSEKIDKQVVAEAVTEVVEKESVDTISVLSLEELKQAEQAEQAVSASEPGTETLVTAKKLPIIKPTSIIELTPGMKKTRPPSSEKPAPEFEQEAEQEAEQETELAQKEAATSPPKPKTLVPVASARGVVASAGSGQQHVQIQNQTSVAAVPVQKTEIIQAPKINITPAVRQSAPAKADQLFARYLGVGKRWTKEEYGNKFTVQLLVLSADDAAADVKKMIVRDEYREHGRKLYILRRDTLPPTLFVCYGVYNSMDEARNARNAMPLFLRKHHPYALSISDLLAKARD